MNENDIRPDKLVKDLVTLIQQDREVLLARKDEFVEVKCPACGQANYDIEISKEGFNYIECTNCTMLYISPRPTTDILSEFHASSAQSKYFNDYIFPASEEARRKNIFIPRVEKVIDICKEFDIPMNKILEVGTGYGIFCEEMVKQNVFKEVVGVEVSDSLAKTCSEKGFRLYNGLLENVEIKESFDVVALFEVIEHIVDPADSLKRIYNLLNDNGILIFSFPNYNGFEIGILREKCAGMFYGHLNYFNEKSISILLQKTGFELVSVETPGFLDVDIVRKELISGNLKRNSFLYDLCVNKFDTAGKEFQEFLRRNNLSSHMMITAKKANNF